MEIKQITGLGKSSVNGYLSYTKAIYKPDELSLNAERINVFRSRQRAVKELGFDSNTPISVKCEKGRLTIELREPEEKRSITTVNY